MPYQIDKQRSKIGFSVKHMMISTVRGSFSDYEAELAIDENALEKSTVTARIFTKSVHTKDRLRDEYLVGPHFFNPEQYPALVFESTNVRLRGSKLSVVGNLTIRDKTRSLTLEGNYRRTGQSSAAERIIFELASEIDREAFGLVFNGAVETVSVVVSKKVKLDIAVELTRV